MALKASDMVKKSGKSAKGGKKSKSDQLIAWIGDHRNAKKSAKGKKHEEEDDGEE